MITQAFYPINPSCFYVTVTSIYCISCSKLNIKISDCSDIVLMILLLTLNIIYNLFCAFIIDFEQAIASCA